MQFGWPAGQTFSQPATNINIYEHTVWFFQILMQWLLHSGCCDPSGGGGFKCAELVTVVQMVGLLTVILTGCYCDDQTDSSGSDGKWRV